MHLLILGGLRFLGRHLVEQGLQAGHTITLFTRGQTNPNLYPEVEKLKGDRDGGLSALDGRRWDAVIDTCGYVPRLVRDSALALNDRVEHYTFISSVSVYADFTTAGQSEDAPLATIDDPTVEQVTGETYGALKALCEEAVQTELPGRALIVRPGLIVGKYDPSDRFTYWPYRVAHGGEVLAPNDPNDPTQIIDALDLARWCLELAERGQTGVYNATGPERRLGMGEVLETCREVSGSNAVFTWVPADFLGEQGIEPWSDMPAWVPPTGEYAGMQETDVRRAVAAGLRFRPLAETVRDTLQWANSFAEDHVWGAGLSREREAEVLRAWQAAHGSAGPI